MQSAPTAVQRWTVMGMTIEKALRMLEIEWLKAKKKDFVKDPVAYALYQVWKKADGGRKDNGTSESIE